MSAFFKGIVDYKVFHALFYSINEPVMNAFGDDQARRSSAALPGGEKYTVNGTFHSSLQISLVALPCFSLSTVIYLKEMIFFGGWLFLTGFIYLIWLPDLHILLQLAFSFGVGFLIMFASSYLLEGKV